MSSTKQAMSNGLSQSNGVSQARMSEGSQAPTGIPDAILQNPSYPTTSLNFLKRLKASTATSERSDQKPEPLRLKILIVGAGLGGLATSIALKLRGHTVQVLEQAPEIAEVGAGIQIPSNSTRFLLEWGVGPFLKGRAVEPEGITFRRWQNGRAIGFTRYIPDFQQKYNAPYYVVHRAHFHEALYQRALELGVEIRVGHKVVDYDESRPSVTAEDGTVFAADLVVAADGIKSIARQHIPSDTDRSPYLTGFAAYRATVDVARMREDPDTAWLLEKPALNLWVGDNRHVMTYTIASGNSFNMVLSHVDRSDPSSWKAETAVADMRTYFEDWDPCLVKIIKMIDKTLKWPLMTGPPQERWLSRSGKLLILGDAAHAMLPYMSQGEQSAAIAVEDGAALAEALNHATSPSQLPEVLAVFERVRALRSNQMQQASLINGKLWHFADGPEQEARDLSMQPEVLGEPVEESANQWSDPVTQKWTYGYDAEEAVRQELRSLVPR